MADDQKLYSIWVYLQAEPLFWLTLTIGAYLVGDFCYRRSGLFPLFNPVALSIIIVSAVLLLFDIQYERYFDGARFIHFLLGPATVALAIPIYRKWKLIREHATAILTTVLLGSCFAILTTWALASMFGDYHRHNRGGLCYLYARFIARHQHVGTRVCDRACQSRNRHRTRHEPQ